MGLVQGGILAVRVPIDLRTPASGMSLLQSWALRRIDPVSTTSGRMHAPAAYRQALGQAAYAQAHLDPDAVLGRFDGDLRALHK